MEEPQSPQLPGPELLGRVLDHLARNDLRAARLAARAFDEASRKHCDSADTITLGASNCAAPKVGAPKSKSTKTSTAPNVSAYRAGPGPTWARFPRLRRLVIDMWDEEQFAGLRSIMAGGGAGALSGVEEVSAYSDSDYALDAPTWAAILRRTPRVAKLHLGNRQPEDADAALAALATVAALAPCVTQLDAARFLEIDAEMAALIAAGMPQLTHLHVSPSPPSVGSEAGMQALWQALPCTRLAELKVEAWQPVMLLPPPLDGLRWPQMRVLSGITLPATQAAGLARGLPGLIRLGFYPAGEWASLEVPTSAAFESVTCLQLLDQVCNSFCRAAPLSRLFPALERLQWSEGTGSEGAAIECDIPGLTRLTHLTLADRQRESLAISSDVWFRLQSMQRLQGLSIEVTFDEVPPLAHLPPNVTALEVNVALRRNPGGSFVWYYDPAVDRERIDVCGLLKAAVGAEGLRHSLRRLSVFVRSAAPLSHAGLGRLARGEALSGVEALCLQDPPMTLHDISALAMLPGLRWLAVSPVRGVWADPAAKRLVAEHAARGLEIVDEGPDDFLS